MKMTNLCEAIQRLPQIQFEWGFANCSDTFDLIAYAKL